MKVQVFVVFLSFLFLSTSVLADPKTTLADRLLEEVVTLQNETSDLKSNVMELQKNLEESKEGLRQVSVASTLARAYLKQIKLLEPEFLSQTGQLEQKSLTLKQKLVELEIVASNIGLPENDVGAILLKSVSEFLF